MGVFMLSGTWPGMRPRVLHHTAVDVTPITRAAAAAAAVGGVSEDSEEETDSTEAKKTK